MTLPVHVFSSYIVLRAFMVSLKFCALSEVSSFSFSAIFLVSFNFLVKIFYSLPF